MILMSPKRVSTYYCQCVSGAYISSVGISHGIAIDVESTFAALGLHRADGKICAKSHGLIQKLYNPNRLPNTVGRSSPEKGREEDPG
jgi:phenylacetyl-CoA:acceptor oxidoreductase